MRGRFRVPAAEGAESPLPVVLYNLFGDAQHVFRVRRQAVAVVDAAADEPYDLVARQQYELPLFFGHRDLGVDQEVAHLLAARHAEGNEPVSLAPAAQREREFQQVGIDLRDVLRYAEVLDRVDVAVFEVERRVAAVTARHALTIWNVTGPGQPTEGTTTGLYDTDKLNVYDKYAMFLHGNNGLSRVEGDGSGKILVIKDSYANCFVPYLTANYAAVDVVDFRNYNYGLDQLIADNDYDQILVLYSFDSFKGDPYLYRAGVAG